MQIIHVNLAKGFRGGERQTELLIKALAQHDHIVQCLVSRRHSPLRARLADIPNLSFVDAEHQLMGHRLAQGDVVHAHEARAVHWAWFHHQLFKTPYLITRRVDTAVKNKWFNRLCYRQAARRVAISKVIQRKLAAREWGEVDLIPSAHASLPHSAESTQAFREGFSGKFLVGHAGAVVDRHKGQRVLLEAARLLQNKLPRMHFVFLGQGKDAELLQQESIGQPNVSWLGFRDNLGDYLAGLDVFAFPSRNEGLGSVLLDVMQAGVPIVASDVGGIPDIIEHETTGLLVPVGDVTSLAQALQRLYDEPTLRAHLKVNAQLKAIDYSPEVMSRRYQALYKSLAGLDV